MFFIFTTAVYAFCLSVVSCGMLANWLVGGAVSLGAWNTLAVLWGVAAPFVAVSGVLVWAEVE